MKRNATFDAGFSGLTIVSQCCHTVRLTSFSVRHVCDFKSTMYCVSPFAVTLLTIFQEYVGSGLATYRSSAVSPARSGIAATKRATTQHIQTNFRICHLLKG